jgi:serine-type D-Ala-D-Ala carboxypeptidase/endopeptidase
VYREPGAPDNPFSTLTPDAYRNALASDPLISPQAPANFIPISDLTCFQLLYRMPPVKPYDALLKERVLDPAGLTDTVLSLNPEDHVRLLQGHGFDSKPLPDVTTPLIAAGASGIYSTPDDILRWLSWHLDRFESNDADIRLLDHAAYLQRDGLNPVFGFDESGHMDAISLGWIVIEPHDDLPLILQKAGGLQGIFSYTAFAPTRGIGCIGAFIAINKFDLAVAGEIAKVVNHMIGELAPR